MQTIRYHHERGNIPASMSKIPLFSQLKAECLDALLGHASILQFGSGEIFLKEGGKMPGLFLLLNGAFQVSKNGREVVTLTKPGELIGEMSFLLEAPHQATVVSVGKSSVFKIDSDVTDALSREHLEHFESVAYRYLARLLAERLAKTSERMTQSNQGDVYYL